MHFHNLDKETESLEISVETSMYNQLTLEFHTLFGSSLMTLTNWSNFRFIAGVLVV